MGSLGFVGMLHFSRFLEGYPTMFYVNESRQTGVFKNDRISLSKKDTVRCKKLATIVSGRKYAARPFVRKKQVSTSAEI